MVHDLWLFLLTFLDASLSTPRTRSQLQLEQRLYFLDAQHGLSLPLFLVDQPGDISRKIGDLLGETELVQTREGGQPKLKVSCCPIFRSLFVMNSVLQFIASFWGRIMPFLDLLLWLILPFFVISWLSRVVLLLSLWLFQYFEEGQPKLKISSFP